MKNKLSSSAERKAGALLSYAQVFLNVIVNVYVFLVFASILIPAFKYDLSLLVTGSGVSLITLPVVSSKVYTKSSLNSLVIFCKYIL